jgi:outer membrane phospholipase A
MRNEYEIITVKSKGKQPLGRSWHRVETNIIMDNKEIGWEVMEWLHVAHDRGQDNEPLGSIKGGELLD